MTLMSATKMTRCIHTSRALQRYLDGDARGASAAIVARHLGECRRCGLQAATYRAIKQALSTRSDVDELALRRLRAFHRSLTRRES